MPGLLARCTFPPPGTDAVAAVSGGADSLALLALAASAGLRVTAVHVDHALRPGSADEADVVAGAAGRLGAGFRSVRAPVEPGPNLEARARDARWAALPPGAMTGHTLDDQAETVLLNLLRGSGADGLAAMRPGPSKPLLALRRSETAALCAELGLDPVVDPTNADLALRRNDVRARVLPLLDEVAGRDVAPLLARTAALLADDTDLLAALAAELDPTDAAALAAAPPAVARRAVRAWLRSRAGRRGDPGAQRAVGPAEAARRTVRENEVDLPTQVLGAHPPDAASVERVLAVARGEARGTELAGRRRVRRTAGRLRLEGATGTEVGPRPGPR